MTGFIVVVVLVVVGALIRKAGERSAQSAPWARMQYGMQRAKALASPPPVPQPMRPAPLTSPGRYQYSSPPQQEPLPEQYYGPGGWQPAMPPHQTTPQQLPRYRTPSPKVDVDTRVRELMAAGNEVAAVRLLCDEADLGIIEAQQYARSLMQAADHGPTQRRTGESGTSDSGEERYVGSAAFATSVFETADDDAWASGWQDDDQDDRTDIDELWRTVRDGGRPAAEEPDATPQETASGDSSVFNLDMEADL
ncbi:MAG: hypothetical protein ACRDPR_05605 [Nocardioidaceae bacterium]